MSLWASQIMLKQCLIVRASHNKPLKLTQNLIR
jgi:hypothetical protein